MHNALFEQVRSSSPAMPAALGLGADALDSATTAEPGPSAISPIATRSRTRETGQGTDALV